MESKIFGRVGEEPFEAMRFAGTFDTVFEGVKGESCLVGELFADARSVRHLVGVVGVSGLWGVVS